MTIISGAAVEAREEARRHTGEFGEQVHTLPEVGLYDRNTPDKILYDLADLSRQESARAEAKANQIFLESFVAEANAAVPEATSARFYWEYDLDCPRLVFDAYLDVDGEVVESEDGEAPDVSEFDFPETRDSRLLGFEDSDSFDGATIHFDEVGSRDQGKARAEVAAAKKLEGYPLGREVRSLLVRAMGNVGNVPAARVENLSDADRDAVLKIFAEAIDKTSAYLREN